MTTFHAVVWIDHTEAHVAQFDREHAESHRVKSRSHHKHQGKAEDSASFFADVAMALVGAHEVLLTGPGLTRTKFSEWAVAHQPAVARTIVGSEPCDHPTDGQLVAFAKRYFRKFDRMAGDPSVA